MSGACRVLAAGLLLLASELQAAEPAAPEASLGTDLPAARRETPGMWAQWRRVLRLEDYNTRIVLFGATSLGLAAGAIGSVTLLRKRALMGDALSHATLPGIALAFVFAASLGYSGKTLPVLLAGAAASGLLGMATIMFIRHMTRLKEDAALGVVLSVYFGAGIAVLGVVQQMQTGHAAGLESFIYGKTASMAASDAWLIGGAGLFCTAVCLLLFKEFRLLCFDEGFAASRGLPVVLLDAILMGLVVIVTIVGLQAVGLILMIALLVIPAAASRFWTDRMTRMTVLAALLGAASCLVGASLSAVLPRLPSGAMIVLVAAALFLVSMMLGSARGVLVRWIRRWQLHRNVDRQHVLRGLFERVEARGARADRSGEAIPAVPVDELLTTRSWSPGRMQRAIRRVERAGLLRREAGDRLRLTEAGWKDAARLAHEHRLWELYLITYAEIGPSKVDRDADAIEHVLDEQTIAQLERLLQQKQPARGAVASPHPLDAGRAR